MNQSRQISFLQRRHAPGRTRLRCLRMVECGIAWGALGIALAACSEGASPITTSTVQGALAAETFPQRPESVQATNEAGALTEAPVSATGDFHIDLTRNHTYTLAVTWGTGRVDLVFPRASGALTTHFDVSSGAAQVTLGTVRYFAAAPAGGFALKSAHVQLDASGNTTDVADGQDGECVNGMILGTGAVCVDEGTVSCEGDHADGECVNGKDAVTGAACSDPADTSDGDGECQDGIDAVTGTACSDPAEAVDPTQPMAVAEHNVPDQVGGCNDGGADQPD